MTPTEVRIEALDAASVALLEPVIVGGAGWRTALDTGLAAFGEAAQGVGLGALSELAAGLRRQVSEAAEGTPVDDEALRATAGNWAVDLLDLCAGRLAPGQAQMLAGGDQELAGRLAEAADRLAVLRGDRTEPESGPAAIGSDDESGRHGLPADALPQAPDAARVVARDELEMLAEEALDLGEEIDSAEEIRTRLAVLAEGLSRIAGALDLLGLQAVADLLARRAGPLQHRAEDAIGDRGEPMQADRFAPAGPMLAELPRRLGEMFREWAKPGAVPALGPLADPRWLAAHGSAEDESNDSLAAAIAAAASELHRMQVVASRQIEAAQPVLDASELSLAIPPDADPSVVDILLRELPALSAQLGERIAAFGRGESEALGAAQRLAHTLKGSANTVGVRGIAEITHRLEDLLQLLAARQEAPSTELRTLLGDAVDCVAEMCEAVAGFGPAPASALAVHGRIVARTARLLHGESPAQSGAMPESEAMPKAEIVPRAEAVPAFVAPDSSSVASPGEIAAPSGEIAASSGEIAAPSGEVGAPKGLEPEIRVPASLLERLLALVDEASILVAHAREQAAEFQRSRGLLRLGSDRLQDLAGELERLVDLRALALREQGSRQSVDALELDEYDDLHTVSRRIGELSADGKLLEQQHVSELSALGDSLARLERLQGELRDCALQTRMAGFGAIASRLHRTVRQAARMAGREAALTIDGEDTLVEADMLSVLVEALAHLLRNAVDHGIETPEGRLAAGKPAAGAIRLAVRREGASLVLVCEDDGRGLDLPAIRERALATGLLNDGEPAEPEILRGLIMAPGFSTRAHASQLSGRGIGLDVVRQAIEGLRGIVAIDSVPGQGTRFTIRVPLGLASLPVMLLRARDRALALALSVRGIERIVAAPAMPGDPVRIEGAPWQAWTIESVLGLPEDAFAADDASGDDAPPPRSALLMRLADGRRAALLVPEPEAPRSVVVRPMPAQLPQVPGIDGVAVLGDGAVAPVLDPVGLLSASVDGGLRGRTAASPRSRAPVSRTAPLCLVVDDSVSVRRATENFVRDLGFEVDGAADGIEALERVRRRVPDLTLVDMEMPRMNGLEFVRALRADPRSAGVAVIMITSRYSERHKALALEAGVDVFLTKPYTEDELASQIFARLERPAAGRPQPGDRSGR